MNAAMDRICRCGEAAHKNAYGHSCDRWPLCEPVISELQTGQRFTALITGTLRGKRFVRQREFVASRAQVIERRFISGDGRSTSQDRVFVECSVRHGRRVSAPALVVAGSIELIA